MVVGSDEDRRRASALVAEQPSGIISKAATSVLCNIADGKLVHPTPGLVQALLELGAEVCFARRRSTNVLKIMLDKDQADVRSNALERAVRNCSHDILLVLAQKADSLAVDQALPIAIEQNDVEAIRILLARGANVSPWCCSQFLNTVQSCSDEIVRELTREVRGACQNCRDKGLVRAAAFEHAGTVRVLLERGANPNFERANALEVAISSNRQDIASLIVSNNAIRVQPGLLDMAIGDAYNQSKHHILITCLQARSSGPTEAVDRLLLQAVERHQFNLVTPILQSNASAEYQGGAVVIASVLSRRPELLAAVIHHGKASQSSMAAAMAQATELGDIRITGHMVDVLLSAGLCGDAANKTLIRILDRKFAVGDDVSRLNLTRLLLDKGGADVNFQQGLALILAATEGWLNILSILIRYGPSFTSLRAAIPPIMKLRDSRLRNEMIDVFISSHRSNSSILQDLKAALVAAASQALCLEALEYLAQSDLPRSAILAGFSAAITSEGWTTPSGYPVIQFLLDNQASGAPVDEGFCLATRLFARDAIEQLADFISPGCVNRALLGLIENSPEWHYPDDRNIWLIENLLEWGAQGEPVNMALVNALQAYTSNPKSASKDLVDMLLHAGDVNFEHGEALKIAIKAGDTPLLEELARKGAIKETMTHAFHEAIIGNLDEEKALELLKTLSKRSEKRSETNPDFKRILPDGQPPIFKCLRAHPESVKLVKYLIKLGCEVDATACHNLYNNTEPESTTAFAWALSQSEKGRRVSSAVIKALIDAKANVNFIAPSSHATPLILAAKNGRGDIVKKLLEAGADPRAHDRFERAALFYASRIGDIDSVKILLKNEPRLNDGSLHEAARNLHRDCVACLIKAKFDPNFRSAREDYGGRNPLQELVSRCDGLQKVPDIEATILALFQGGASPLEKWEGKTALFLAFDNMQPYNVTQALLNTGQLSESNNPKNVIDTIHPKTGTRVYFSPTVYLRQTTYKGNATTNAGLERLLRTMGCEDRYFAGLGEEQPENAVGLPEDIAKDVKRRKDEMDKFYKSEYEHTTKIRRHFEEHQAQHELWQVQQSEKAAQKLDQTTTAHQTQLHQSIEKASQQHHLWQSQEREKTAQKIHQSTMVHQNQLHQREETARQQQGALAQKNALTELSLQHQQGLKLSFQQQSAQQKIQLQSQQNKLTHQAQKQKQEAQKMGNKQSKEAENQKAVHAKRMQAMRAAEERSKLQNKKAAHREDLTFQRSMNDLKSKR
ncbi:hypothetical protein F5Y14DRAFT_447893 [Nemania sp. NC0429]|nr:hypothetical protein F5Y14DRAFT_447893 [Nemania sp. NC0429]